MQYNQSVIQHHTQAKVPIYDLKSMVKISPDHLREKDTWYMCDGKLQYFKERDEVRMFSELFCEEYAKKLGFKVASYDLAVLRDISAGAKVGEAKLGLLTPNYQDSRYNYYLVSDLLNSDISNLGAYGNYSLSNLITFLRTEYGDVEGVEEAIQDTVNLFLFDYMTDQEDRNPKNICFEVDAEPGSNKKYWGLHGRKVKRISLATLFDNERSLGITKTGNGYQMENGSNAWDTSMPYCDEDVDMSSINVDPHVFSLFVEETDLAGPMIERLANQSEYLDVINNSFSKNINKVMLNNDEKKFLIAKFLGRQEALKRILKY